MALQNLVKIHSRKVLLPDGTKSLPELMLSCGIHRRAILQQMPKISIPDMNLKIIHFILPLHLPGASQSKNSLSVLPQLLHNQPYSHIRCQMIYCGYPYDGLPI